MKVKVANHIFDSKKEPIVLILTKKDKANIKQMLQNNFKCHKIVSFPDNFPEKDLNKYLKKAYFNK